MNTKYSKTINKNNNSSCSGVSWDKKSKRWKSRIGFNNKSYCLGSFKIFDDAKNSRTKAEQTFLILEELNIKI